MHLPYYHSARFKTPFARVFQESVVDSKSIMSYFLTMALAETGQLKTIFGLAFVVTTPYYVESNNFGRCSKVEFGVHN